MPVNTPPPHTPYEAYAPTPVPDISPTNFVQGQSPPAPSIQESPAVLAVQRETPVTVKKQPRQSGKQMVHAPYEREGQLKGDAEREKKGGKSGFKITFSKLAQVCRLFSKTKISAG